MFRIQGIGSRSLQFVSVCLGVFGRLGLSGFNEFGRPLV